LSQKAQPLLHAEVVNLFDGRGRRFKSGPKMKGEYREMLTNILRKTQNACCLEMSQKFR
jgi:hypothetical protein